MGKTFHLTLATLAVLAAATLLPSAPAAMTTRTYLSAAAGADFGDGVGLYEPSTPTYCLALRQQYAALPVPYYVPPNRYWPAAGSGTGVIPLSVFVPEPFNCVFQVPGDQLVADSLQADAGTAAVLDAELGPTQVANLVTLAARVRYCATPAAVTTQGPGALSLVGPTFTGQQLACAGPSTTVALTGTGCLTFTQASAAGSIWFSQPLFLADSDCNSLRLQPAGDFVAEVCVEAQLLDVATGLVGAAEDSDFFVVGKTGGLLVWASTPVFGGNWLPNVSNLEPNVAC